MRSSRPISNLSRPSCGGSVPSSPRSRTAEAGDLPRPSARPLQLFAGTNARSHFCTIDLVLRGFVLRVVLVVGVVGIPLVSTAALAHGRSAPSAIHRPSKCVTTSPIHGGRSVISDLRRLGTRVWSNGLSWAASAPQRPADPTSPDDPAYRWPATLDHQLTQARSKGIEPVLNVRGFPSWSNEGRGPAWAPKDPQDFADFMAAAVRKYPQVRRWIIVSEPGNFYNFRPQGGDGRTAPHLYASLLDTAYGAMHAVRPDVVVIGGGIHPYGLNDQYTTAPDTFITNMVLPNGRRPRLDMFAINPYTERRLDLRLPKRPLRVDFDDLDWLSRHLDRL